MPVLQLRLREQSQNTVESLVESSQTSIHAVEKSRTPLIRIGIDTEKSDPLRATQGMTHRAHGTQNQPAARRALKRVGETRGTMGRDNDETADIVKSGTKSPRSVWKIPGDVANQDAIEPALEHGWRTTPPCWIHENDRVTPQEIGEMGVQRRIR